MELVRYNAAKQALAECESIDECKDWKDKGAAMAAYAKMRDDKDLENKARRIRGRATRRIGELLLEVEAQPGRRTDKEPRGGKSPRLETRKALATTAGLSTDDAKLAIRVARVPENEFEDRIEAECAPTLEELAAIGRRKKGPTEEELAMQNRKDALKEFYRWQNRWNMCSEMKGIKKSAHAIARAFSNGDDNHNRRFFLERRILKPPRTP